jgi:hypothetical protein
MPLLGKVLRNAINLAHDWMIEDHPPAQTQEEQLRDLLRQAQHTQFGRDHDFAGLLQATDIRQAYQERVPIFDYDEMYQQYWYQLLEGKSDISWPGHITYFAVSSGTTGSASKHLPVSEAMIQSIRQTGMRQLLSLKNFDLPEEVYEKEILMLGSSTQLQQQSYGLEGQISGISASNIPAWLDGWYYRPGKAIAAIHDWDDRIAAIVQAAPEWDVGALAGIPSWVQLMLKRIIAHHGLDTIHDIWPHLTLYSTGGVAYQPYQATFNRLLARPLVYLDTYLASEGFIAYNSRPETEAMQLALDLGLYLEFVPFTPEHVDSDGRPKSGVVSVPIEEVQTDTDYVLLVTTCAGAWRYMIGDTVRFTDRGRSEILISGRTQSFLNVVGSQLSESKLNQAVSHLEQEMGVELAEYAVAAQQLEGRWTHQWYLGMNEGQEMDMETAARVLDEYLQAINENYEVARSKALEEVHLHPLPIQHFYDWLAQDKEKGGQTKMPRVLSGDKWESWQAFLSQIVASGKRTQA